MDRQSRTGDTVAGGRRGKDDKKQNTLVPVVPGQESNQEPTLLTMGIKLHCI